MEASTQLSQQPLYSRENPQYGVPRLPTLENRKYGILNSLRHLMHNQENH